MHFEKVSLDQFLAAGASHSPGLSQAELAQAYEGIALPRRSTAASAGYDFVAPWAFRLAPGQSLTLPTGIRAFMDPNVVLMIFPRSGLGSRFRMQLANTVGLIDADYVHADNQGHIMVRISNDSQDGKTLEVAAGDRFVQGIFLPYLTTDDDTAQGRRTGGHGSTGK